MARFNVAKKPKPISIDKFLGINESVGETEIQIGEAIVCRNFNITPNYKPRKRDGRLTYHDEVQPTKVIQGMWQGKIASVPVIIFACNGNIRRKVISTGNVTTIGTMTDARTRMFYFQNKLFLQNGSQVKYYDGTTFGDITSIAYTPTVAGGGNPLGVGVVIMEQINLISGKKKQDFVGNATTTYNLVESGLDATLLTATLDGVAKAETTHFTVVRSTGVVTWLTAPPTASKVTIEWEKANAANVSLVLNNTANAVFGPGNDTTVFLWGNPDAKNRRTYSSTNNAMYWPANNFTDIGNGQYAITDMQPQQGVQTIWTEDKAYFSVPELAIAPLEGYIYPVYDLNEAIGNVCFDGVQVIRNNPVSLYGRTVWEWLSTSVKNERNVSDKGTRMAVSFDNIDFTKAVTFDYQKRQELWINVDAIVYIWNYGNDTWYIYDNITANCFLEIDGMVYYGTKDGKIERFEGRHDNGVAINAVWKSGFVDFGAYEYKKNSKEMWVSIQPESRTSITVKCPTNRMNEYDPNIKTFSKRYVLFDFAAIDFNDFSFDTNRNPQVFKLRINAKNYSFIQFIMSNNEIDESLIILGFKVACETNSLVR